MDRGDFVETTLGDLIVALSEETARHVTDEREACIVVAYILSDLFRNTATYPKYWQ